MRRLVSAIALSFIVLSTTGVAEAQTSLGAVAVDSSVRIEALFGSQLVSDAEPPTDQFERLKFTFNPRLALLSGTVELSPLPWASGRLAGGLSVFEPHSDIQRSVGNPGNFGGVWNVRQHFTSWEAAGLYHLWNGGGYRFSVTAGYRRQNWEYSGGATGYTDSPSRDSFASSIPFLGLQTAMYFPWWKARFEVLGSPFMSKTVSTSLFQNGSSAVYHVKANRGGLVEFQVEGTTNLSPNVLLGLFGRVTVEELYGTYEWAAPAVQPKVGAYLNETLGTCGLNLTLQF